MIVLFEGIVMCFVLLLVCVVGIANDGPVGLVTFYEKDVQRRVVELGLVSEEQIRRQTIAAGMAVLLPMMVLVPLMVFGVNGAQGFWSSFRQMTVISLIAGLFDRLFIDWWWVEHTNAWVIPGTEDLRPYIHKRTLVNKWVGTLIAFPVYYALLAWIIVSVLEL
jgi:hypothetical protein